MKKNRVKKLEDLVGEYKERKVNYSTYEFDELSYRTLILDIHTMLKENKKYKEVINKAIKYIEENKQHEYRNGNFNEYYLELNEKEMTELLDILKEVEHEKIND